MEPKPKKRSSISDFLRLFISRDELNVSNVSNSGKKWLKKKIFIILLACHTVAFVQSLGFAIQHTAFPYLTKSLGLTPRTYGYVISFTSVLQLVGGVFCGRLSDIYGGRFTLIISFISLSIGYLILAVSSNTPVLIISRVPLLAAHALQSMYVILSDVTYQEERADMIGKIGASHGLGMIVGSVLGGLITDVFGITAALIVASVVVLACVFIAMSMIPSDTKQFRWQLDEALEQCSKDKKITTKSLDELISKDMKNCKSLNESENIPPEKTEKKQEQDKEKFDNNTGSFLGLKEFIEVAKINHIIYLLSVTAIAAFPFGVVSAMFTLVLMDYYGLDPKQNGLVLSYLGVVGMVTQGYVVGLLDRHATDSVLILFSAILTGIGYLFLIISENIYLFCVVAIPLTVGGSLIHIIITSLITKIVPKDLNGSALGLTLCTHATIRSVAPTIGGYLFEYIGFYSFGVLGYAVNLFLSIYLVFYGKTDFGIK